MKTRSKSKRARTREEADADDSPGGLVGLHPILVGLLSVCTLGLFGLVYAFAVCSAFGQQAGRREIDSAGRPVGRPRHPLKVFLLSYLTLGLYSFYWAYQVMEECRAYTGRQEINPRTEVALMLAFPPYAIYVRIFRLPELVRAVQQQAKLAESTALGHSYVFLIPCLIPALPLLSMVEQDALNQVWFQAP